MKKTISSPLSDEIINEEIKLAVLAIYDFIDQVTGQPPTQTEIAAALKRYFVLNEIKEHIVLTRSENMTQNQ